MIPEAPKPYALTMLEPLLGPRYQVEGACAELRGRCVYRAVDLQRRAQVELHVPTSLRGSRGLEREIHALSWPEIPALPRPLEFGDTRLSPAGASVRYLVYDAVRGYSLAYALSRIGVLSLKCAIDLVLPLLDALEQLHARGVCHGGISPSTVWLRELPSGRLAPFLRFFGELELAERCDMLGSLPPELLNGGPATARTDLFAVGALVMRCVTGEEPAMPAALPGNDLAGYTLGYRTTAEWNALRLDPRLTRLLRRATDPEPLARFDDAASLRESLLAYSSAPDAPPSTIAQLIRTVR